jgi:hypothetical protein
VSARPTDEAVSDGVEDEVGQHLPVVTGGPSEASQLRVRIEI